MRARTFFLYCHWNNSYSSLMSGRMFLNFIHVLEQAYQGSKFTTNELEIEIRERLGEPQ